LRPVKSRLHRGFIISAERVFVKMRNGKIVRQILP